jgi:hypothetical protein
MVSRQNWGMALYAEMPTRVEIDCLDASTWEALLEATILKGWDAELLNFDYTLHGSFCDKLAKRRNVELVIKPKSKTASVRQT